MTFRATLRRQAIRTAAFAVGVSLAVVAGSMLPGDLDVRHGHHSSVVEPTVGRDLPRGCTVEGLPEGVIPSRAVIERNGRVRVVSFDHGWAVYEGKRPGVLVAVCR